MWLCGVEAVYFSFQRTKFLRHRPCRVASHRGGHATNALVRSVTTDACALAVVLQYCSYRMPQRVPTAWVSINGLATPHPPFPPWRTCTGTYCTPRYKAPTRSPSSTTGWEMGRSKEAGVYLNAWCYRLLSGGEGSLPSFLLSLPPPPSVPSARHSVSIGKGGLFRFFLFTLTPSSPRWTFC